MNPVLLALNTIAPLLTTILVLAGLVGGIFVFRNAKKTGIILIQDQTITALQQQIDALKEQQTVLQKKNEHLEYVIETMSLAMKKKGVVVSIDGEMVTFTDSRGQSNTVRRAKNIPTPPIGTIMRDDLKDK